MTSTKIVNWLNTNIGREPLLARAENKVSVPAKSIDLNGNALNINGSDVDLSGSVSSAAELTNRINAISQTTKVFAQIGANGEFLLQNLSGFEANPITISSGTNVLRGISRKHEPSIVIEATRSSGT